MTELIFEEERRCLGPCGDVLPLSAFPPDSHGKDGLRSKCRDCRSAERRRGKTPGAWMPGLRAARKEMGLTQEELAGMLGVDRSTLSNIERGHAQASGRLVTEILVAFVNLKRWREGRHEFQRSSVYEETLA